MDESNIAALLAFYNLLAAKIGLEDCKSLKDVRNLLPILANYMKVGVPNFVVDPNFGFRNAIALIALELDEEFQSQLNAEAAESGDVFEATKIHMAMIYTFRLLQTEAFSTICEQLEDKHQRRFAHVIECLDDRHRWSLVPWPKLLSNDSSQQLRTEDSDEDKENGMEVQRLQRKPSNFAHTPKPCPARKLLFFPCGNSPIQKVVTSPRGHEVVRIHALEREVKSLRVIRDLFGHEKDKAEELCLKREQENNNLLKTNVSLKSRLDRVLPVADQLPLLEGHLSSIQEQIGSLARSLKEAQTTGANAQERVFTLQFELDELEIKHGELQEKHDRVVRKAEDESKKLQKAQQELLKLEEQNAQQKSKVRELRTRLKDQESKSKREYDQKVEEIALLQNELEELKKRNDTKTTHGTSLFAEFVTLADSLGAAVRFRPNSKFPLQNELDPSVLLNMGSLFSSKNKPNRPAQAVTDHDRTTLSLKMQRDKLRQACQRYERNVAKDAERARALLRDGRKDRALLLLKRKRYQETMINRVSGYIEQVERMITDVEMARINKDVFDNLRLGNEALKALNETISLDEVERIMEEGREAQEFQEELSTILGQRMSEEDSELVEEEFERMLSEQLPTVPTAEPTPATGEAETRRADAGKEPKRRREAVALETS
uniref:Uncharacterized protein n=1 Tax=Globodera rostochiensis TaxID=31243 RepID=A0A914IC37_GLORO